MPADQPPEPSLADILAAIDRQRVEHNTQFTGLRTGVQRLGVDIQQVRRDVAKIRTEIAELEGQMVDSNIELRTAMEQGFRQLQEDLAERFRLLADALAHHVREGHPNA